MSRKTILILIAIALILLGAWMYVSFKTSQNPNSSGQPQSFLSSLFPFGNSPVTPTQPSGNQTTEGSTPEGAQVADLNKSLFEVSSRKIAGLTMLSPDTAPVVEHNINGDAGTKIIRTVFPKIRFAERGTGYIYDIDVKGQNETKISDTVIARTAQALFTNNGESVLLRYIKSDNATIASFLGKITPPQDTISSGTLVGNFLEDNINDITLSPDGKTFFFISPAANGILGVTMKADGTGKKQQFISSFAEWLPDWGGNTLTVTAKASGGVPGYVYTILSNGAFSKILGNVPGLTTKISPDGKTMLYSTSGTDNLDLHVFSIGNGADTDTGLATLPEKCVWTKDSSNAYCGVSSPLRALYPDSWYKGITHFHDAFWKINIASKSTLQINTGEGISLDATQLSLDPSEKYLVFVNKNDGSLWSLDLTQ